MSRPVPPIPEGSSFGNSKLFPDLHRKMSKKIAQLIKVIFHLNSRNEDNGDEIDAMTTQHENDLKEIMKDAARKLNSFKSKLEERKENAKAAAALGRLKEQYESEKS